MPLRYPCEVSGGTTWVVVSFRIVTQLSSLGNSSGLIRQKTWTGSLSLDVVNTGFDRAGVLGGLVGTLGGIFDLLWKKKVIPQSKLNKTGCQPVKHNSLTSRKMWIFNKKKKNLRWFHHVKFLVLFFEQYWYRLFQILAEWNSERREKVFG